MKGESNASRRKHPVLGRPGDYRVCRFDELHGPSGWLDPAWAPAALVQKIGGGNDIPLLIQVTEAFATLTSLTVTIQVDDNTSFSSATTVASSHAVPAASLVAGYQFPLVTLPNTVNERYVRLYYTVAGSNATAGTITASIATGLQTNG